MPYQILARYLANIFNGVTRIDQSAEQSLRQRAPERAGIARRSCGWILFRKTRLFISISGQSWPRAPVSRDLVKHCLSMQDGNRIAVNAPLPAVEWIKWLDSSECAAGRIILMESPIGSSQLPDLNLANGMMTLETLEDELSRPIEEDVAFMQSITGDVMVLGAGGKMGPSLARRARRAADEAGGSRRIFAVSRFASESMKQQLAAWGVEPISCDLLDWAQAARLPDCGNVLFLAGRKFGSTENLPLTWATNALLPALVMERFRGSRIVALSSGNIYPLVIRAANEQTPPDPVGEYAQSVLARERILEYFSARDATPATIIRLNYAIDLRYGVLLDIGERVWQRRPVPLVMGSVNVIWQGDANSACLRALALAAAPPVVLNLTGPGVLRVRSIAERFGEIFGVEPTFEGSEAPTALLSDSSLSCRLLGRPRTSPEQMIEMTAEWIRAGLPTLNKPTHFEVRDGAF